MIQIIPGVLATTEADYVQLTKQLKESESLEDGWVQIDIMDGEFVNNTSVSAEVIKKYPLNFQVEAHLMVRRPEEWLRALGGFPVKRFVAPVEIAQKSLEQFLEMCQLNEYQVGLSINPETPVETIKPFLGSIDEVLVMSVHPGYGGQEFMPEAIEKVKRIRAMSRDVLIGVDGGVTLEVVPALVQAGVNNLVIGAKRLEEGEIDETLEQIWEAVQG